MDYAHKQSDKMLKDLEKRIEKEYRAAAKEVEKKSQEFLKQFKKKDTEMKEAVMNGTLPNKEYIDWKKKQILIHQRKWKGLCEDLTEVYMNADKVAASMINDMKLDVYVKNYNYGTYEIENGYKINTNFRLYDRDTVARLVRDNPKLLPPPGKKTSEKIRRGELKRWNQQQLQSVMTQGILRGESVQKIAKNLSTTVGEKNMNSAIRAARTMCTSAENAGRINSYKRAEDMGIPMKKQWLAAHDGRTRRSHRQYDGMSIPIKDEFAPNLMYPGDPDGAPEEVYNCRCTLVADLDIEGLNGDWASQFTPTGGYADYDDWVNDHKSVKEKTKVANDTSKPYHERIKAIRDNPSLSTEEKIKQSGEIMSQEMEQYYKPLQKEYDESRTAWKEMQGKASALYDEQYKVMANKALSYSERGKKYDELTDKIRKLEGSADYKAKKEAYDKARKALRDSEKHAQVLKDKLGAVRRMGADGIDLKSHLNNSRSPMRKHVESAYSHYPRDWVEKSVARGYMTVGKVNRGYYLDYGRGADIRISGDADKQIRSTTFHELGHRMERAVPEIRDQEKLFYDRRTKGEPLVWLGSGYSKSEKTRKDNFIDSYMGKDYGGSAYELVSMGFQYAYTSPTTLAKDRDMQNWIHGILCIL